MFSRHGKYMYKWCRLTYFTQAGRLTKSTADCRNLFVTLQSHILFGQPRKRTHDTWLTIYLFLNRSYYLAVVSVDIYLPLNNLNISIVDGQPFFIYP